MNASRQSLCSSKKSKTTSLSLARIVKLLTNDILPPDYRLWHQIADELICYFKDKTFDAAQNEDLLILYESMVKSLTHKLNPIKYAVLTVLASRQHADIDVSIEFLD